MNENHWRHWIPWFNSNSSSKPFSDVVTSPHCCYEVYVTVFCRPTRAIFIHTKRVKYRPDQVVHDNVESLLEAKAAIVNSFVFPPRFIG
jgi:hypothetical protein